MTRPYLLRLAAGLALLLPAACTSPAPPAPNLTALFADALHCRVDFPDGRDRATAERLRAEGVEKKTKHNKKRKKNRTIKKKTKQDQKRNE